MQLANNMFIRGLKNHVRNQLKQKKVVLLVQQNALIQVIKFVKIT